MSGFAWVTLATNDSYCLGALVLAHSLKRVETKHDIAVLITPGVTAPMREKLSTVFNLVKEVNVLDSQDETNLALLARPELGITFTKLHCWRLTEYEKCVFVDADTLVIRNCDELFEREELSAAPDVGWPDCFNSGVFVFRPSQQTFASLTSFAAARGSFDGGDQGLLNLFFSDWAHKDISKHLPFIYNMCSTASYSYLPAYKQFGGDVKIIHFIGNSKPWLQYFDTQSGQVHPTSELGHLQPLLQRWWDIFCENVHPQLSSAMLSNVDAKYREVSRILAPCENRYFPPEPPNSSFPHTSVHVCHTSTDETYDEVDVLPNFSEFKDPWENYVEPSNPTENIHPNQTNNDSSHDDNCPIPPQNYQIQYCLIDNVTPLNNIFNNFKTENFNEQINNLITNNSDYSCNEDHFDSKKTEQHNKTFTEHFSDHFISNVETKPQDKAYNSQNENDIKPCYDHESRMNQLNHVNNRNEENFPKNSEQNYSNDSNQNDKVVEIHQNDDYCNMLQIEPQQHEQLNLENSAEVITQKLTSHIEKVIKCNKLILDTDSHPNSCTDLQSIASQSELNNMDQIDSAGIAGALSRLTLGEPRSPEQMIYEDHIRKQSWEQGQIDYMGRDSFDNIWKKICTTLSTTPEEKPQTKEKELPKPVEKEVPSPDVPKAPSKPVPDSSDSTTEDKPAIEAEPQDAITDCHSKQTDKKLSEVAPASSTIPSGKSPEGQATFSSTPTSPLSLGTCERKAEPILALTSPPPQLCIKEFGEKGTKKVEAEMKEKLKKEENKPESVIPLSCPMSNPKTSVEESTIIDSPVPIQVAESVLEADIKESVSEDVKPVGEEAISSTSALVQETISAVVHTPLEPLPVLSQSIAVPPPQPNGSALDIDPNFAMKREPVRTPVSLEPTIAVAAPLSETRSAPVPPPEALPATQETKKETKVDDVPDTPKACQKQPSVSSTKDVGPTKVPESVPQESKKPMPKAQSEETKADVSSEASKPEDSPAKVSKQLAEETKPVVPSDKTEPACSKKSQEPAKPVRSKELKIPGTPIVTEATPPTSPPLEAGASLPEEPTKPVKKVIKKATKKGSEDKPEKSEGEEGKKGAKKVVKKVVKKPKEGEEEGESSTAGDKPKKVVKTVKKTTKPSSQTLEADACVPDTPPPTTAETPVPPKRKVKSTTTKTSKKSESES